ELSWGLATVRFVTAFDSIWLQSELSNGAERRFLFDNLDESARPVLILTPKGKPAIERPLLSQPGLQRLAVNRQPKPREALHKFRVDLRGYFGKLEPGDYQIQVVYPRAGYRIQGLPGFTPADLRSPVHEFTVTATTLKESQHEKSAYPRVARDEKPDPFG